MDIFQSVQGYITKIVSQGENAANTGNAKMKILLLDKDTVGCPTYQPGTNRVLTYKGSHRIVCNDPVCASEPFRLLDKPAR